MSRDRRHRVRGSIPAAALLVASIAAVAPAAFASASARRLDSQARTPAGVTQATQAAPEGLERAEIRSLMEKGQYAAAETLARALVAQVEAASGAESPEAAEALDLLVEAFWQGGKGTQEEARMLAERAVAIKERAPDAAGPSLATSLFHLAAFRAQAGAHSEARPLFERALAIRERILGPEHPDVAFTLNVFGNSLSAAGDFAAARRALERGLAIREQALGPTHLAVAGSLNNLAVMHYEMHDLVAAQALVERAVAIWEKELGPDHPRVGLGVSNLAVLHAEREDYAGARPLFERALAIQENTLGPAHPAVALTLSNLANALQETGDLATAEPLHERSLAIREQVLGPEHLLVATTLLNTANLAMEMGDDARARKRYDRALGILEKTAGAEHPLLADVLLALAAMLATLGETDDALALALRSDGIWRENVRLTSRTLAEREALTYAAARPAALDLALTLVAERAVRATGSGRAAWDALVRSRSLVLDEMAARHRSISGVLDPQIGHLNGELVSAREVLAKLVVRGPRDEPPGQYRDLLDQARRQKESAERALAGKSVAFRTEQARARLGLDDVAAALPADCALLAFVLYDRRPLGEAPRSGEPQGSVPSYLALVLRGGERHPTVVPLGSAAEIGALVSEWRARIDQQSVSVGRALKQSEAAYRAAGAALGRVVWEPVEPHLAGAPRVFVVPDGVLHFVNLAALPVGSDRYLADSGPVLHYLSTERDLVLRDPIREGEGLLAVGAPAFDYPRLFAALAPRAEPTSPTVRVASLASTVGRAYRGPRADCETFVSMSFESLPDASLETDEIAGIWAGADAPSRAAADGTAPAPRRAARILTGGAAHEAAVKEESGGHRILHLATHGFFLGSACPTARDETATPAAGAAGENPLLLAGLALAGANHRAAAGAEEEDGVLTAEEVAALDLDGVEWAVLSACDTGAGELEASEGVFGLRRAFQVAGARTVITSLWAVEDASTRAWMTTLYRNRLVRGLDTAAAVHETSLALLEERRARRQSTHPFYWAGFVAVGDWR